MIRRSSLLVGLVFVLAGIVIGLLVSAQFNVISIGGAADRAKGVMLGSEAEVPEAILSAQSLNAAFVAIVQDVKPTVVTISTRETRRRSLEEHPFFRYFGDEFRRRFEEEQPERQRMALGSGIIVSQDGYILTNRHVVNDAEKITVTLLDRQEFDAVVVGSDSLTEVAVIKVEGEGLPVARLGESDSLSVGEWVLAFGNPFGLNFTVTQGIVSALGRSMGGGRIIPYLYGIENFIQTSAVINPGNSGGPLVNLRGEVTGINTAIQTPTGSFVGYGFAIPITLAKRVMSDLIHKGRVVRAYLGISMEPVDQTLGEALGMSQPRGIFLQSILEDSPAEKAKLKQGDVVLEVNGVEVNQPNQVQSLILRMSPGEKVTLTVLRDGNERKVEVTLGELGADRVASAESPIEDQAEDLGLSVQPLTDDVAEHFEYTGEGRLLVTDVEPYGPAWERGVRKGDVLLDVKVGKKKDWTELGSVKDFRKAMEGLSPGETALFRVERAQGGEWVARIVAVKVPKER